MIFITEDNEEEGLDAMFNAFIARPKINALQDEFRQEFEELQNRPGASAEDIEDLIKRNTERREALFQELENIITQEKRNE